MPYATSTTIVPADQQQQMVDLYRAGKSLREIAEQLYWSKSTVSSVLRLRNVQRRPRGGRRGHGGQTRFARHEVRQIIQLYRDGSSPSDIARRFGTFDSTIYRLLRRERIPLRPKSEAISLARRARLATAGMDALRPRQRKVLNLLETLGPRSVPDLARLTGMKPKAARDVVTALETFGLVTKHGRRPYTWKRSALPLRDVLERALDGPRAKVPGDTPLPIDPFVAWVDGLIAREERKAVFAGARNRHGDGTIATVDVVAARLGVPARVISRWRNDQRTIGLLYADRILTRADGPRLTDLWPEIAGVYVEREAAA